MSMILSYRMSIGEAYDHPFRKVSGEESEMIALRTEQLILEQYGKISISERDLLKTGIEELEKSLETTGNPFTYNAISTELSNYKQAYSKYKKGVITYNENYQGEGDVFCTTEWVELTDEEIEDPMLVINEAKKHAERFQKWQEESHDKMVDKNIRERGNNI